MTTRVTNTAEFFREQMSGEGDENPSDELQVRLSHVVSVVAVLKRLAERRRAPPESK